MFDIFPFVFALCGGLKCNEFMLQSFIREQFSEGEFSSRSPRGFAFDIDVEANNPIHLYLKYLGK